jgi:hypothetical protein
MLAFLQKIVTADKTALVSSIVSGLALLASYFGFNLNASTTAYLSVLLMTLAGLFTHVHFARKTKTKKPAVAVVAPARPADAIADALRKAEG